MSERMLVKLSGTFFSFIALVHFARIMFRWESSFAGLSVPFWVSVAAVIVAGYLAYESFRRRAAHYVCGGSCGGFSPTLGTCEASKCTKKGMPLEECRV